MTQYSGVYTLQQQGQALTSGQWATDPYYKNTTLLLHADGVAGGAQNNTFLDSSTNAFAITRNGNTTQGSFTPYGANWSNYFDGSSELSTPDNAVLEFGSGDFTIEAFIYPTSTAASTLAAKWATAPYAWYFGIGTGNSFYITGILAALPSPDIGTAPGNIQLNKWNHIAVVRSGADLKLYLNGSQSGTTYNIGSTAIADNATPVTIGRDGAGNPFFNGYISNFRIVVGTAVYTGSTYTVPTANLTAISNTALLTCQSNRFADNSSNSLPISVAAGAPSVQRFSPFPPQYQYTTAVIGGSGSFDGSGDYLNLGAQSAFAFGTGDFTIEMWVYFNNLSDYQYLIDFRPGSTNGAYITLQTLTGSNNIILYANSGNQITSASNSIVAGAWTHVALTRASGSTKLFINGTQSGSTYADSTNYLVGTNAPAIAANNYTAGTYTVNGYISDVRIVKGSAVYTTTFTPPTAPLTSVANTSLLCNMTNAGIYDNAMMMDFETVGNAQVNTSVFKYGSGSLYFDGSGDYLSAANSPQGAVGGGDFTIEMWINLASNTTQQTIITKGGQNPSAADQNGWSIFIYSSTLYFFIRDGSGSGNLNSQFCSSATWTSAVANNTWAHLAIVRSGTTITAYANGVSLGSLTSASNPVTTDPVIIGSAFNTSANFMTGYIDDLRITKGVARYTGNFIPPKVAFANQ